MPTKPTNSEFKNIFDKVAVQYDEISNPYLVETRKKILGGWAKGKCLEVGAGTGEISKFLSAQHQVVSTDIAPGMVEEIRKRGLEAYECDAEKLPFEDNSFDSVISAEMLFYLDNPDKFLAEASRVLRPGGRLLISGASNFPVKLYDRLRSFFRALGLKKGMYFEEDTLREFMTFPKIRTLLQKNHFQIIEEKQTPILPIAGFAALNQALEKTPLKRLGIFIFVFAQKNA